MTREPARAVTPLIMGVVNASIDSLTGGVDAARAKELARSMVGSGASILDCGGQSLRTDRRELTVQEELTTLLPVVEAVAAACPDTTISVDTYRAEVAEAALDAGASIVNDPSGLLDPAMAELVAERRVQLVVAYSRATPKVRMTRDRLVANPMADAIAFLRDRLGRLDEAGVRRDQLVLDPGPDLGKSPEQSIQVLRGAPRLRAALGVQRVLWPVSRKDFVGALVHRFPSGRDPGTYGALSAIELAPGDIVRVHDVAGVSDFFTVRRALLDGHEGTLDLPEKYRYDP
ncbi:MAG: dihydropteroate synthase [Microthrixaceae bacterium]|nr:dihydropteroate synthase [Microthrixaceae bacterium]MCO5317637.1 dihydropteroate synthase [Microthrixaceae bacterium]